MYDAVLRDETSGFYAHRLLEAKLAKLTQRSNHNVKVDVVWDNMVKARSIWRAVVRMACTGPAKNNASTTHSMSWTKTLLCHRNALPWDQVLKQCQSKRRQDVFSSSAVAAAAVAVVVW